MKIVKRGNDKIYSLPTKEISPEKVKAANSELARGILKALYGKPSYPLEIARLLGVHEQKVYYHVRKLEKAGFIKKARQEVKQGVLVNYYALANDSFFIKFGDFKQSQKSHFSAQDNDFLFPFIKDGELDAIIVLGSPEAHGPEKARARDGYYGMNFTLFLGTFLSCLPRYSVKLDTEVTKEDLKKNLIIIGGPVVNKIAYAVNKGLPVYFDEKRKWAIRSKLSKKTYPEDECGLIIKAKNPFAKDKSILVIGGKRFAGTRAAITAFLYNFDRVTKGNKFNKKFDAIVVEGVDADSDGVIDSVEIKE